MRCSTGSMDCCLSRITSRIGSKALFRTGFFLFRPVDALVTVRMSWLEAVGLEPGSSGSGARGMSGGPVSSRREEFVVSLVPRMISIASKTRLLMRVYSRCGWRGTIRPRPALEPTFRPADRTCSALDRSHQLSLPEEPATRPAFQAWMCLRLWMSVRAHGSLIIMTTCLYIVPSACHYSLSTLIVLSRYPFSLSLAWTRDRTYQSFIPARLGQRSPPCTWK